MTHPLTQHLITQIKATDHRPTTQQFGEIVLIIKPLPTGFNRKIRKLRIIARKGHLERSALLTYPTAKPESIPYLITHSLDGFVADLSADWL